METGCSGLDFVVVLLQFGGKWLIQHSVWFGLVLWFDNRNGLIWFGTLIAPSSCGARPPCLTSHAHHLRHRQRVAIKVPTTAHNLRISAFRSTFDGVAWFGFHMLWGGLEWFISACLIKIVWCGFSLDFRPLAA